MLKNHSLFSDIPVAFGILCFIWQPYLHSAQTQQQCPNQPG